MSNKKKIYEFTWIFLLFAFISIQSCNEMVAPDSSLKTPLLTDTVQNARGALLATDFKTFEALKAAIKIEYFSPDSSGYYYKKKSMVRLTHFSQGQKVVSDLAIGISEDDFTKAKNGGILSKVKLGFNSPYFIRNRNDLLGVFTLARRDFKTFGEGDLAFYHLAETMLYNINEDDLIKIPSNEFSEKGYINTFNHILAQAFMTTLYSEKLADYVADSHERTNLAELISGNFTEAQLLDLQKGPIDNYVDMINNEWGQELGKRLKNKLKINRDTYWTPELLANYLNEIQKYFSWAFGHGFSPFTKEDEKVITFSRKINFVMDTTF